MITLSLSKFRTVLSIAVLTLAVLPPSHAQSVAPQAKVNVPFAFEVGSQHFAPGVYTLSMDSRTFMTVRSGSNAALMMTSWDTNGPAPVKSKAIFHKYGDRYFLAAISSPANAAYIRCAKSKSEEQARKLERSERASANAENTNVELALSQTSR